MFEMTVLQLVVALFMSLGGVCLLVWAWLDGQFEDVERAKYLAYWSEVMHESDNEKDS